MHGPFIPPEPHKGDPNTIGGYAAVHGRPAAFQGCDGLSYTVELLTDATGQKAQRYAAWFLFMRWNETAEPIVTGHLETGYLEYGATAQEARSLLGKMPLSAVKEVLDALIDHTREAQRSRPWWEAMRDEDEA